MVDRPHILERNRGLADNHGQSPGKVGEGLAQSPQSYESRVPKRDRLLFLNMFKKQ